MLVHVKLTVAEHYTIGNINMSKSLLLLGFKTPVLMHNTLVIEIEYNATVPANDAKYLTT